MRQCSSATWDKLSLLFRSSPFATQDTKYIRHQDQETATSAPQMDSVSEVKYLDNI